MPDNNGVQYTNPPQSRNEELLEDIITDQPYTAPPQSEIEEILVSIIDETPYSKAPTSRNADLLLQVKEKIEEGGGGGSPITLKASFKNTDAGNAYGEIVLLATSNTYSGTYNIMWADDDGVMENYKEIGTVVLDVASSKPMGSIELMEFNAIPKYATRILAIKNNEIAASYTIPQAKRWAAGNYGEHLYSVLAISDWHYGYDTSQEDIEEALTYGNTKESVVAVVGAGDLSANGYTSELNGWKAERDLYRGTTPVYSCVGNHEAATANAIMYSHPELIRQYLDSDWVDETTPYFLKVIENDVYIFMSLFDGTTQGNKNTMFTTASLDWLEENLETYRNQRVFLFAHVPPIWSNAGLKQNGQYTGFALGNGAYTLDIWGTSGSDRTRFLNLLDHYKNVIWFSGHSHIKYQYQSVWDKLNIMQYKGGARFIHVSSLTVPRDIIDGSATGLIYAESEGALIDVYQNVIRMRCRNFAGEKFYGANEYIIDTTPVTIPSASKTVVSLTATKEKTSYYTDEQLSVSDITATASFSDGTSSNVSSSISVDASQVDISEPGTYTIGISYTYEGTTVTTSVQVTSTARPQTKTLASIVATKGQTAYTVNDVLSTDDITAVATYSDNSTANIQNSALSFDTSDVDMANAGAYTIVVSYTEDGVTVSNSVGVTVSSSSGGYTVIFDAEWDGTIASKGGAVSGENITTMLSGMTISGQNCSAEGGSSDLSKPLFCRILSDTGLSYSAKVGFGIGVGNSSSKFYKQAQPYYSYTSGSWTALKTDNDASMELTASHNLLTVACKSSSSSGATFPVNIKARIQIGYQEAT